MLITQIEKYKGSTYSMTFDNDKTIYTHSDIIYKFSLKINMDLSEDLLNEIIYFSEKRKAKERALYLLDYRDHSYKELFVKLSKNYSDEICYEIVNHFVSIGIINDKRYAENLAKKYIEIKKYGLYKAKQEMYLKGIDKYTVEDALEIYKDNVELRILELINKKYKKYLNSEDENSKYKLKNALVRQGYTYDEVNRAISMMDSID